MKNIIKILLSLLVVFSFNSCKDATNTIDTVLSTHETGAILRTVNVIGNTLNSSDDSSTWSVEVEEQDVQDGALFKSVDVYVSLRDLTPNNGTTVANDFKIKTIDASAFSTGPLSLPRGIVSATFGEAASAMGLTAAQMSPGDLFVFELRLNLTDGRVFGANSAAGIITGGYFSSPFKYNALLLCSPEPGDYRVVMHDSYGDGWQTNGGNGGNGIQVTIDGAVTEVGLCTPYGDGSWLDIGDCTPNNGYDGETVVNIPVGTVQATWNFPGDQYGEISFEVYGPHGTLLLAVGLGEGSPGLLPITLCKL
ncbi:MAG: hypothetical protein QM486_12275 [Flavobacteriaceae bacterium]